MMRPIASPVVAVCRNLRASVSDGRRSAARSVRSAADRVVRGEFVVQLRRELALLPVRVERGERVLPAPDDERPRKREHACDRHRGTGDSQESPHLSPVTRAVATRMRAAAAAAGRGQAVGASPGAGRAAAARPRSGTARTGRRRARRAVPPPRRSPRRSRSRAAGRTRAQRARRCTTARPSRDRSGLRTTRGGAAGPAKPATRTTTRTQSVLSRTCGSHSQTCRDGSRKISANGICCHDEQRDDAEREQRGGVAGELLLRVARRDAAAAGRARRSSRARRARRAR